MQSWFTKIATQLLEELVATGGRDVETQSLLGSAYKDLVNIPPVRKVNFAMQI